nr:MAG TPA: hypothetical protein [Caudoviricetes sp.]
MPKLQRLLNNTLQWFLIHYNQTPVQVKWRFWLICSEGYYLIFKTATLKVKVPVGFPIKQTAQF